ncbi:hypothetical protein, partial [Aneurinibacillus terranovensis]|uniref:hypothetical protein n=1 Tax=Aneurinibacillus terranovensis TaxID=278991 RepID=UPI00055000EF
MVLSTDMDTALIIPTDMGIILIILIIIMDMAHTIISDMDLINITGTARTIMDMGMAPPLMDMVPEDRHTGIGKKTREVASGISMYSHHNRDGFFTVKESICCFTVLKQHILS